MALSNFVSKLNWRLIVLHLIACGFFIYAFLEMFVLHDFKYVMNLMNHGGRRDIDGSRLANDLMWNNLSPLIGLLTGFLVSLAIAIKKHWHWINSLIVFLIAYLLWRFDLFGWRYLKHIFLAPGSLFKDYTIGYFLVNGLVMLAIGLLLFFSRRLVQFIIPVVSGKGGGIYHMMTASRLGSCFGLLFCNLPAEYIGL